MAVIDNMDFDELMAFEESHSISLGSSRGDASLARAAAQVSIKQTKQAVIEVAPEPAPASVKKNVTSRARKDG